MTNWSFNGKWSIGLRLETLLYTNSLNKIPKCGPVLHAHIQRVAVEAISLLSPGPWEEVFP